MGSQTASSASTAFARARRRQGPSLRSGRFTTFGLDAGSARATDGNCPTMPHSDLAQRPPRRQAVVLEPPDRRSRGTGHHRRTRNTTSPAAQHVDHGPKSRRYLHQPATPNPRTRRLPTKPRTDSSAVHRAGDSERSRRQEKCCASLNPLRRANLPAPPRCWFGLSPTTCIAPPPSNTTTTRPAPAAPDQRRGGCSARSIAPRRTVIRTKDSNHRPNHTGAVAPPHRSMPASLDESRLRQDPGCPTSRRA